MLLVEISTKARKFTDGLKGMRVTMRLGHWEAAQDKNGKPTGGGGGGGGGGWNRKGFGTQKTRC